MGQLIWNITRRDLPITCAGGDDRAFKRHRACVAVTLRGATGNLHSAEIENISFAGCMVSLALPDRLKVGRVVSVRFGERVHVTARVVWSRHNQAGLRFSSMFDRNRIALQLRQGVGRNIAFHSRSALRLVANETPPPPAIIPTG